MQALDLWTRRGMEQGELKIVLRMLNRKLGQELPAEIEQQIRELPEQELTDLADALLDMSSLSDLTDWLSQNDKN